MAAAGDDRQALETLYRDLCRYSIEKDDAALRRLFAPEYVLVHMTGMRQSADDYVEAVLDGTLNYFKSEHDSIDVSLAPDGRTARIRGRTRTDAAVFGGGRHTWRLQQDLKAAKRDGRWYLTESCASTY